MALFAFTIARADPYDTAYEVWARAGTGPIEYGDGIYVGNFPILPHQTSISGQWNSPSGGRWVFSATQVQRGVLGATSLPEAAL
jgi:hypothetical protein